MKHCVATFQPTVSGIVCYFGWLVGAWICAVQPVLAQEENTSSAETISFDTQVQPILQEHCLGCHQPAKQGGDYLMTQYAALLEGGESGNVAIVPGQPDESYLLQLITPHEGQAEMPQGKPPLSDEQVTLIRRWIQQGAINDSSPQPVYDLQHPPSYPRPPVVTALAVSPTQGLLAVTGIHEVKLIDSQTGEIIARLIGQAPRLEAVRFSPDGSRLAVAGGSPGRFGELQIWNVAERSLVQSVSLTGDVLFGCSWSPDGTKVAFGGTDNTVRAIDAESGEVVLFQNVVEDWVRDTVFSVDGSHLISVGRDMTCKLTEVATERFVDNITSITPGVLKGGISSVARHPERDEILLGSADGIPKLYRVFRETKRVIGDDANLIRKFPEQLGRIQSVAIAPNGQRLAAASTINGQSEIAVYDYQFETQLPDEIKAINAKVVTSRSEEEKQKLETYVTSDIQLVQRWSVPEEAIYALTFVDNQSLALAGSNGQVQFWDSNAGALSRQVDLFSDPKTSLPVLAKATPNLKPLSPSSSPNASLFPEQTPLQTLKVFPESISINSSRDYVQVVAQAYFADGTQMDVSDQCDYSFGDDLAQINQNQIVQSPERNGETLLTVSFGQHQVHVPVAVNLEHATTVDFRRDVNPLLGKLGCNAGTCHGSQAGKRGFKLSLRGYDPLFDIRALTDDLSARRVNVARPDESLMLLKATAGVPHEGGKLMDRDGKYYDVVRQWIAAGAKLEESPKVISLSVQPSLPVLRDAQQTQQFRIIAHYADGTTRDVTREAFVETGNQEVATVDPSGRVTAKRRGEAAILARYEGAFAATTLTVMGQRPDFAWHEPPANNAIDDLVADKWQRMKIQPSQLCDDYEFLRRLHLDLTGLPPTPDTIREFVSDARPTAEKRNAMIDTLIGSPEFVDHWTNKWSDLLQVNEKFLGAEGASKFHDWIREQVATNLPYDQFVYQILTASGSNAESPAASYFKILRTPEDLMENTTHLFLATRFNCNKCHDHPFERWTQDQYYQTAAWFSQVGLQADPSSGDRRIGGTAVEGAKPLFEMVQDTADGEMVHQRTQEVAPPVFPFDTQYESDAQTRRQQFADWLIRPENPYFATSYANRLWGYLLGVGLIEPVDDIRASNPPSNPKLLAYLTQELIEHDFDTRHLIRLICQSRVYQLSSASVPLNEDDTTNYSHAIPRRLPAEVLFDTLHQVTGSETHFAGQPAGVRAAQLPDAGGKLSSGLLATLGRPVRESACECERSNDLHLGSVLALVSGPDQATAIADQQNALPELVSQISDNRQLVNELFLRILNRPASDTEIDISMESFQQIQLDHARLVQQLQDRHTQVDGEYQQAELTRLANLKSAQQDLDSFVQQTDPQLAQKETEHQQQLQMLTSELDAFNANSAETLADWRQRHLSDWQWHPLLPTSISQSSGASSQVLPDRSIRTDNKGKTVTTTVYQTDLPRVSAVRLEALAIPDLPGKGPGLAPNGNFVVNELKFEMESPDAPGDWKSIKLIHGVADFTQQGFPIDTLFDGNETQQGWAVHPDTGKTHWVSFQLETPLAPPPGTRFRFQFVQNYPDGQHQLGHYRISFSPSMSPVGLSLSEELLTQLVREPSQWDEATRNQLQALAQRGHPRRRQLEAQLQTAKQPLTIDPGIVERREKVAQLQIVTPRDTELVRLESEVQRSQQQLEHLRLTASQDLTWALINSPSFLFNH